LDQPSHNKNLLNKPQTYASLRLQCTIPGGGGVCLLPAKGLKGLRLYANGAGNSGTVALITISSPD